MEGEGDRRKEDRRKAQLPFAGDDRRRGERRAEPDRRAQPRNSTLSKD